MSINGQRMIANLNALRLSRKSRGIAVLAATVVATIGVVPLVPGNAQAEQKGFEVITTPIATPFVNAIAGAANVKDVKLTEMNSIPAFEELCGRKAPAQERVVLTAMTIPPGIAETCAENGIAELFEAELGFLTLVIVQKTSDPVLSLSPRNLYEALAAQVPEGEGFAKNVAQYWSDVDPKLPKTTIKMIMAPRPGVTRKIFEAEAMMGGCRQFPVVQNIFEAEPRVAVCTTLRASSLMEVDDGTQRLETLRAAEPGAIGLIPIDMYRKNKDWLRVIPFGGILPTPEDINAEDYNLATPIYVYADPKEIKGTGHATGLHAWIKEALGESAIGDGGYIEALGLTTLPSSAREWQRRSLSE